MIWGRQENEMIWGCGDYRQGWVTWFAWYPTRLMDGRWAWLEFVDVTGYMCDEISPKARFHMGIFCRPWVAQERTEGDG
jgi:hypothetical protein